jgi:hypothetical protein
MVFRIFGRPESAELKKEDAANSQPASVSQLTHQWDECILRHPKFLMLD